MEWQPIETAPTEKIQDVLVWDGDRVRVAWFCDDDGWNDSTVPDHFNPVMDPQPTHWMPFPEPPQAP